MALRYIKLSKSMCYEYSLNHYTEHTDMDVLAYWLTEEVRTRIDSCLEWLKDDDERVDMYDAWAIREEDQIWIHIYYQKKDSGVCQHQSSNKSISNATHTDSILFSLKALISLRLRSRDGANVNSYISLGVISILPVKGLTFGASLILSAAIHHYSFALIICLTDV